MKRSRIALAALLCLALALSACAKGQETAPDAPQIQTGEPAATEPTDAAPQDEPALERPAVENNGGYFVRVDGKVWFRYYDDSILGESRLWGEFLGGWSNAGSTMCYYDEQGDAVCSAFADDGFGPLWFGVDGFYLTRATTDASEAYFKTPDGAETVLRMGAVAGVSDNGRFAAVASSPERDGVAVYEGLSELYTTAAGEELHTFCALTDDGTLVYLRHDSAADTLRLGQKDADGTERILGTLPQVPEDSGAYDWEFEQCLLSGGEVWCVLASYAGTGHFLNDVLCVRATLGAENSVETVEDAPDTEYPVVPKLYCDENGTVRREEHAPGELVLSNDVYGDLIFYGADGAELVLTRNLIAENAFGSDEGGMIEQTIEFAGDAAYLIVARADRDAEGDVGWRMAYRSSEFYYLRVPLREGAEAETLIGETWIPAVPAEDIYAGLVGTWRLVATEVEGDRSDVLPDGMDETIEFRAGEVRVVIDSSNGENSYYNDFDHAEAIPTNGVSADAAPYGLLLTSDGTDDMMYCYLEGDTLVATVMMHLDSGDSVSRTGFYTRAE